MAIWKGDAYFFRACVCFLEIWSRNLVINLWLGSWQEMINTFINEYFYYSTVAIN